MGTWLNCSKRVITKLYFSIVKEVSRLLHPHDFKIESSYLINKTATFSLQYRLISLCMILKYVFVLLSHLFLVPESTPKMIVMTIILCVGLIVLILSFYMHIPTIRVLSCFLSYIVMPLWVYYSIKDHNLFPGEGKPLDYATTLMRYSAYNLMVLAIMMNQPLRLSIIFMAFEKVLSLSLVFYFASSLDVLIADFVTAAVMFLILIFYTCIKKTHGLDLFLKVHQDTTTVNDIVEILNSVSDAKIYVLKLPQKLQPCGETDESMKQTDEERYEQLAKVVARASVETHSRDGIDHFSDIKNGAEFMSSIESIYFDSNSKLTISPNKNTSATILEYFTKDFKCSRPFKTIIKDISERSYVNHCLSDIIMDLFLVLNEYSLISLDCRFNLSNLNNSDYLDSKNFRFFDAELIFLSTEVDSLIVFVKRDITERVVVGELEEHSIEMDRVLNTITHDMRAPLHAILGYTEILTHKLRKGTSVWQSNEKHAAKLAANCEHLGSIVSDILDWVRLANGRFQLDPTEIDLAKLVDECIKITLSMDEEKKKIKFGYYGPRPLPLLVDRSRLKRVLLNLLSNALKYTDKGEVRVEATLKDKLVKISVVDTGRGIHPKNLKSIFTKYFNSEGKESDNSILDTSFKEREFNGVGLGLASAKKLVQRLGPNSTIDVKSKLHSGSRFTFYVYRDSSRQSNDKIQVTPSPSASGARINVSRTNIGGSTKAIIKGNETNYKKSEGTVEEIMQSNSIKPSGNVSKSYRELKLPLMALEEGIPSTERELINIKSVPKEKTSSLYQDKELTFKGGLTLPELEFQLTPVNESPSIHKSESQAISPGTGAAADCQPSGYSFRSSKQQSSFAASQPNSMELQIVILDDESVNREILNIFLERYFSEGDCPGFKGHVEALEDFESAANFITKQASLGKRADIIFTDYHLDNEKTGSDFVRLAHKIFTQHNIKQPTFVLVSGAVLDSQEERQLYYRCLQKPFDYNSVCLLMNKWIENYGPSVTPH